MIEGIVVQISNDMAKKKDIWFLETLEKYNLIKSDNITNFDIYWLKEEMGVNIVSTHDNKTQIYIEERLVGEWDNNYQLIKIDDYKYEIKINRWN